MLPQPRLRPAAESPRPNCGKAGVEFRHLVSRGRKDGPVPCRRGRYKHVYGCSNGVGLNIDYQEPIALFGYGRDVLRMLSVIAECLSQLAHSDSKAAVEIDECVLRPDAVAKFRARHHLSRVLEEYDQETERLLLQLHGVPFFRSSPAAALTWKGPNR